MIIELHEKYDVSPEWFEGQSKRDPQQAWEDRLGELLAVYRVQDKAGAENAAEKMIASGLDAELIKAAIEIGRIIIYNDRFIPEFKQPVMNLLENV